MPARAIDTATLTFGLVAIPVKIYATGERSHEVHFHLVHEGCGERVRQQYVCPTHGAVERDDIIKGYEITRGNFIELSRAKATRRAHTSRPSRHRPASQRAGAHR